MNKSSVKRILFTGATLASMPLFCGIAASASQTNANQSQQPYNVLNRTTDTQQDNGAGQRSATSQSHNQAPVVSFGRVKTYPLYQFNPNDFKFSLNTRPKVNMSHNADAQLKVSVKKPRKHIIRPSVADNSDNHTAPVKDTRIVHIKKMHHHINAHDSTPKAFKITENNTSKKPAMIDKAKNTTIPLDHEIVTRNANAATNPAKLGSEQGTHVKHFKRMFKVAKSKLGDRYVWGGIGANVFDCSGFTQYIYNHGAHKVLPRTAGAQYEFTKHVSEANAKPGDLVFFGTPSYIEHVGMYIGHGKMIDAQLRGVIIEHIHRPWWNLVGFGHYSLRK